ncbi:ADP-ribosyl cyclase/cyclic ADP-ribose hydrolase [Citrus sinensis]|nr:ADP-ribosyl cyclase/cyclic ADP-ribose hydrolase [Citrus sinensis]
MSIQGVSSYVPYPLPHWKYDVFLSFRGEDTRKNFTDHLYSALDEKGIIVFRDDKELERGESISPGLFKAIEESKISIVVFSRSYAFSTWCLDELVHILECKNTNNQQMVYPIFYDVEPAVVRKQTETFQEAFAQYEEVFSENIEKVISSKSPIKSGILKHLVGIDSHLKNLRLLMDKECNVVCMIGICVMGGIGKTTLAGVVYDLTSHNFEASSCLANVREISEEGGLTSLQNQLLSQLLKLPNNGIWNVYDGINIIGRRLRHKKVLLIIDDVVDIKQLECLAGKREWFGPGSRIVITSRDKHLLMMHGVDEIYNLRELHDDKALQLFCKKAFKSHQPSTGYEQLSKWVAKYSGGLPLALKVLGSFLYGKTTKEWESALKRLKRESENEILDILKISFDGLRETEKKIFLDIACFYQGENRDYVTKILDYCDFDPVIGIRVLIDKSLIEISTDSRFWMHDLLKEICQQIVKRQSPEDPGKRSRLWKEADIHHMLTRNTGTKTVEVIKLENFTEEAEMHFSTSSNSFLKMINLRMLLIRNLQLPEGLEYLSNELRLLERHGYPLRSLPSNFQPDKIVELNMRYSRIEQMWCGIKAPRSRSATTTPVRSRSVTTTLARSRTVTNDLPGYDSEFSEIMTSMEHLLELHLEGTAIRGLPVSIEHLTGLVLLNLRDCKNLETLPSTIDGLKSLRNLYLSGCSKLKSMPGNFGKVESLEVLDLSGCKGPPLSSSWYLPFLISLMRRCSDPMALGFPSLSGLCSLRKLDLSDSNLGEGAIPNDIGNLCSLKELYLSKNSFITLPASINRLFNLEKLELEDCKRLQSMPQLPPSIEEVRVNGCASLETLSGALKLCNSEYISINCIDDLKLLGCNGFAFSMLKEYLEVMSNPKQKFDIVVPGSEIPEWFMHQNDGSSIKFIMPSNLYCKNKALGYAVCCVFHVHNHSPAFSFSYPDHCCIESDVVVDDLHCHE